MASPSVPLRGIYYGWAIVLVCVLSGFATNGLTVNSYSLFLRDWSHDFGAKISDLQLGIAGLGLISSLISPFIGTMADRFPARNLIAIGLACLTLFCVGMSYATSYRTYILLYALLGSTTLTLSTTLPANALVARWFVRGRGLALGLTAVGLGLAGVVMPPIVAYLLPLVGWRQIWLVLGFVSLFVLIPLVLLVLRDRRPGDDDRYMQGAPGGAAHHGHGHGGGVAGGAALRTGDILSRRTFWLLVVTYIPMLALYGGGGQNLAPIATSRGLTPELAGIFLSLYSGVHVLAMLVGGVLSDRVGNRLPLVGLAFLCALGGVLLATQSNPVLLGIGAACLGCGNAFWPLIASAAVIEYGAGGIGRAMGMLTLFVPLTGVGPVMVAKVQEHSGSYAPVLLILAGLTVLAGLACLLFLREKRAAVPADMMTGTLAEPAING